MLLGRKTDVVLSRTAKKQSPGFAGRPIVWIVGALAVVAVIVTVLAVTGGEDDPTSVQADDASAQSQTNDVIVTGTPLPRFDEIETTAAGAAAPEATGVDFAGDSVTLLEPGVPTVIGFFAHWCPHCQAEVDELSRHLSDTGLPDDVNVIAVSTGVDSTQGNYPPSAWFESEGWPTAVLSDDADSSVAQAYGLPGFPFWAIVDADGNLVSRTSGGIGSDQFDAFVDLARAGA